MTQFDIKNIFLKYSSLLVLLGFLVIALWTYRSGVVAAPRSDHFGFMAEREYSKSDIDYFIRELSITRTRVIAKGDTVLFLPGMWGVMTLIDIFFRHNLYVIGVLSILMHALTTFSLFLLITKIVSRPIAFLLCSVFLTHLSGMEMVFWRHISAYMLSLFFFGMGLKTLADESSKANTTRTLYLFSLYMFISALFHEVILGVLILSGFIFLLLSSDKKPGNVEVNSLRRIAVACFAVTAIGILCNAINYAFYNPPIVRDMSEGVSLNTILNPVTIMSHILLVSGIFLSAILAPSLIRFSFPNLDFRAEWNFSTIPNEFFYGGGIVLWVVLSIVILWLFIKKRQRLNQGHLYLMIFALAYVIAVILGFTIGRALPRSVGYLKNSTYYFYLANYSFMILISIGLSKILTMLSDSTHRRLLTGLVILISIYQLAVGMIGIDKALSSRKMHDKKIASSVLRLWEEFKNQPEYCYGGSVSSSVSQYVPNILLFRKSCNAHPEKIPLYILDKPGEGPWLMKLNAAQISSHLIFFGSMSDGKIRFSNERSDEKISLSGFVVSDNPYRPIWFQADVHGGFVGGLVFGYSDMSNFSILIANERYTYIQNNKNGNPSEPFGVGSQVLDPASYTLSIKKIGNDYAIFYNRMLLSLIPNIVFPEGNVGLYRKPNKLTGEYFSNLTLLDGAESGVENVGEFEPIRVLQI